LVLTSKERCGLADTGNMLLRVVLNAVLETVRLVRRNTSFGSRRPSLTGNTDVFMIFDCILR
jgi:deferrochelatase/peroxidase EfeB